MPGLFVSAIAFFIAAWYLNRYLDQQEIAKGMTRGVLVLTLAALVSWGAGALLDWAQGKSNDQKSTAQTTGDLSRMLKAAGQAQP